MPVFFAVAIRVLIYVASMLVGAGITTATNKYLARRRERRLEERRKKRSAGIEFKGFESEAHEHGN